MVGAVKRPLGGSMKYRRFEPLARDLSRLVLGTAYVADWPEEEAFALLDAWVEAGGNTIDCARQYGDGGAERVLGRWLAARRQVDVTVITKGAHHVTHGLEHDPDQKRVTSADIAADLEESLDALGVDRVDLYFLHRDDPARPVGPIVDILNDHLRAGRIAAFGGSNWTTARIAEANAYARLNALEGFSASSPGLNLAEQNEQPWPGTVSARDRASREWYRDTQTPLFAWSSLAGGFFAGVRNAELDRVYLNERNLERLRRAEELAGRFGVTANEVALAWVLHQPFPTYALIGPRNPAELHESLAALDVELTPEDVRRLELEEDG
jgi:1-deoxyxylulose-5-phosphate synthase